MSTRIFIDALNNDANTGTIIYFYGNGGNGKTSLLEYLQDNFCIRVDEDIWQTIKGLDDKTLREKLLEMQVKVSDGIKARWVKKSSGISQYENIPSVLIDFGVNTSEVQPQNPYSVTCFMRKELAGKGLKFELFDYAYVLYLSRTGRLNDGEIKNVICDGAIDSILEIIKISSDLMPGSGLALKLLHRILGGKMYLHFKERKVDKPWLEQLHDIKSISELESLMPYLFALDIEASMKSSDSPTHLVLFFDTHEKFWQTQHDLSPLEYFRRDAWLRIMLNVLYTSKRVVTVVAGRVLPRWSEASKNSIPTEKVITHQIGLIPLADARESLEAKGITDAPLREAIVRFTEVERGEVHPMYLGICADSLQYRLKQGITISPDEFKDVVSPEKLGEEVLLRLLSDVPGTLQSAIVALSVCRSFNYAIFRELAQNSLGSSGDRSVFEQVLTQYSFVKKLSKENFQIHQIVLNLIEEIPDFLAEIQTTRRVLENYFRTLADNGDDVARAEAIYYSNKLDAERGMAEWLVTFRDALDQCRWLLCDRLSELSREFTFVNEASLVEAMHLMGKYYYSMSRYADAEASYLTALEQIDVQTGEGQVDVDLLSQRCAILNDVVELLSFLSEHDRAEVYFQRALAAYKNTMDFPGCGASVYSGKSVLLRVYGYEKQRMSNNVAAEKLYVDAAAVCDQALVIDGNSVDGYANKAAALNRLSELKKENGQVDAAFDASSAALDCVEKALQLQPGNATLCAYKGSVLRIIGKNYLIMAKTTEAKIAYDEALKWMDQSLCIAPKSEQIIFKKGILYTCIGEMLEAGQKNNEAEMAFKQAIACFGDALSIAPQDAWVHSYQASVLQNIGTLRSLENKTDEA